MILTGPLGFVISLYLDMFLLLAVKDKCCANHSQTIVAIDEIQAHTIENVFKNWVNRIGYCKASCGSHINDVEFYS